MKLRNLSFLLACGMLLACTGCNEEDAPAPSQTDSTARQSEASATEAQKQGKHHISVETVEISLSDLKAQDYTVPVLISLDKNAGITYAEWGASVDSRCTFTVDDNLDTRAISVYYSVNDAEHFLWTAWASGGTANTNTGAMLLLQVKLPLDASAGDFYTVDYADWSLADKGHAWNDTSNQLDWVESDDVTWTNGGILVTE